MSTETEQKPARRDRIDVERLVLRSFLWVVLNLSLLSAFSKTGQSESPTIPMAMAVFAAGALVVSLDRR